MEAKTDASGRRRSMQKEMREEEGERLREVNISEEISN